MVKIRLALKFVSFETDKHSVKTNGNLVLSDMADT